jgi:hypothetical protein
MSTRRLGCESSVKPPMTYTHPLWAAAIKARRSPGGVNMLMVNGSMHFVAKNTNPDTLNWLAQRNDGEPVSDF